MRAFAVDVVASVAVLAGRAGLFAALSVETGGADLVTLGAVPASLAGQAAAVGNGARLQSFALATPGNGQTGLLWNGYGGGQSPSS